MGTGMDTDTEPNRDELRAGYVGQLVEALRVLVVGGMPAGVLVAGVVVVGAAVDSVERPESWTRHGRRRWVLPMVLVACSPPVVVIHTVLTVGLALWIPLRRVALVQQHAKRSRG
jgi:hypothetical protein